MNNISRQNECYTYFKITGNFDPRAITEILGLSPEKQWRVGDKRRNGTEYDFALWEFGRCGDYNVLVEKQMLNTIQPLLQKVALLRKIKKAYDISFTLEIVPSLYVGETEPCLAPSKEVIRFCYKTDTEIDIDLYLFDSSDD